ncbi:MAG: lysophospholipid acyltransferase family protein [Candidatus Methylomirabilia bacterium]
MTVEGTLFYRSLRLLSALPQGYFHFRVEGAEHVPPDGPCVIAANHASYVDPIALWMACPRHVRFIVDREQYLRPLVHWMAVRTGAIPVENNPRDLGSFRRALLALKQGAALGIFPEGGRSGDGSLKAGKPGAALLALRAGVPLLPAGIVGAFAAYSRHHRFPRPRPILVRFGAPVDLPAAWQGQAAREHLEEATARLMARIRALAAG